MGPPPRWGRMVRAFVNEGPGAATATWRITKVLAVEAEEQTSSRATIVVRFEYALKRRHVRDSAGTTGSSPPVSHDEHGDPLTDCRVFEFGKRVVPSGASQPQSPARGGYRAGSGGQVLSPVRQARPTEWVVTRAFGPGSGDQYAHHKRAAAVAAEEDRENRPGGGAMAGRRTRARASDAEANTLFSIHDLTASLRSTRHALEGLAPGMGLTTPMVSSHASPRPPALARVSVASATAAAGHAPTIGGSAPPMDPELYRIAAASARVAAGAPPAPTGPDPAAPPSTTSFGWGVAPSCARTATTVSTRARAAAAPTPPALPGPPALPESHVRASSASSSGIRASTSTSMSRDSGRGATAHESTATRAATRAASGAPRERQLAPIFRMSGGVTLGGPTRSSTAAAQARSGSISSSLTNAMVEGAAGVARRLAARSSFRAEDDTRSAAQQRRIDSMMLRDWVGTIGDMLEGTLEGLGVARSDAERLAAMDVLASAASDAAAAAGAASPPQARSPQFTTARQLLAAGGGLGRVRMAMSPPSPDNPEGIASRTPEEAARVTALDSDDGSIPDLIGPSDEESDGWMGSAAAAHVPEAAALRRRGGDDGSDSDSDGGASTGSEGPTYVTLVGFAPTGDDSDSTDGEGADDASDDDDSSGATGVDHGAAHVVGESGACSDSEDDADDESGGTGDSDGDE